MTLLLVACAQNIIKDEHLDVTDTLNIEAIVMSTKINSAGFLTVNLQILNQSSLKQVIFYNLWWLDKQGRPIETLLSERQRLAIAPLGFEKINAIAPNATVRNFKLITQPYDSL